MMPQASLTTDRLKLRPIVLSDAPAIQRHFGRWEIIKNLSAAVPWPYPEDGAYIFIRDTILPGMESGNTMAWAIVLKEGPDEAIGLLEYRCSPDVTDNRGFWLAVEHQGRGYMTEAVTAFQDHIFFDLSVEHIHVLNSRSNAASRRIKEKTGAEYVGTVKLDHHEGDSQTQKWIVTRERWALIRGRKL